MPSYASFFDCQLSRQRKLPLLEKSQISILTVLLLIYLIYSSSLPYITSSKVGKYAKVIPYYNRFQLLNYGYTSACRRDW